MDTNEKKLTGFQLVKYFFTSMEFFPTRQELGPHINRKDNRRNKRNDLFENKNFWTALVYFLASLGIFCRQITRFPQVKLDTKNIQWDILAASFIIGLAVLPFFIRRVNSVEENPGIQQVLAAFGVGFFMDFTTNAIINFYFKQP